jgi:hypothetical protein
MSPKIYCKNYECPFNRPLRDPINFKFSQIYVPFEDDKCKGYCNSKYCNFDRYDIDKAEFTYELACCENDGEENTIDYCDREDCKNNEEGKCIRIEILVDNHKETDKWVCKCFAFRKIRGHMDWSVLLEGGRPRGGNIDDAYAEKLAADQKKTKSYRTHMKQKP